MRPSVDELKPYLEDGETIRWSGQPPDGALFQAVDILFIPFSLIWGSIALAWNLAVWLSFAVQVLKNGFGGLPLQMWFMPLFGLPFLIAAYYITVGRFQSDAVRRGRLVYAITNRRAIIASGPRLREVRGYELVAGAQISVSERGRGTGTIVFGQPDPWGSQGWGARQFRIPAFTFERIPQVRDVARLIDDAVSSARR